MSEYTRLLNDWIEKREAARTNTFMAAMRVAFQPNKHRRLMREQELAFERWLASSYEAMEKAGIYVYRCAP